MTLIEKAWLMAYHRIRSVKRVVDKQRGPSGPMVYAQEVQHPGFPGREFNKVISEKWRKEWPTQLGRAIATEFFK